MGRRDDEDPGLPVKLNPCSNGEFLPEPMPPVLLEAVRRARDLSDHAARRAGMSRRDFLLSLCGSAVTLMALDACTREAARPRTVGGRYGIRPEATYDPEAARRDLAGEEFVMDVQGHLLEYDHNPAAREDDFWTRFPQRYCGEDDPRACFSIDHFLTEMFLRSDTTMVVLSALPIAPEHSPLTHEVMDETRRVAGALCRDERILLHGQALPNVGALGANLEAMEDVATRYRIAGWKTFTHFPDAFGQPGHGWWLDDAIGERFIEHAVRIGTPIICVHKGLSGGSAFASPRDVGPAARGHPDASFVVYHSGFEVGTPEGPFTRATAHLGVNRLIASLRRAGIRPGGNVHAELGSTWRYVMRYPDQAAHVIGKLLKHLGEDNIMWGTDCLFYGSPQDQIQAFRAFHITEEYQERYGYPPLTKRAKAKILGLNAARVYGVDPVTVPCRFTRRELEEEVRRSVPGRNRTLGPSTTAEVRAFREDHRGWP
ncbi:MAG TPA: amidohydrolase family protein [Actinomycetota bacterium]|nr:amidohydrolase family protein [Actinomycetota bacterium]